MGGGSVFITGCLFRQWYSNNAQVAKVLPTWFPPKSIFTGLGSFINALWGGVARKKRKGSCVLRSFKRSTFFINVMSLFLFVMVMSVLIHDAWDELADEDKVRRDRGDLAAVFTRQTVAGL